MALSNREYDEIREEAIRKFMSEHHVTEEDMHLPTKARKIEIPKGISKDLKEQYESLNQKLEEEMQENKRRKAFANTMWSKAVLAGNQAIVQKIMEDTFPDTMSDEQKELIFEFASTHEDDDWEGTAILAEELVDLFQALHVLN